MRTCAVIVTYNRKELLLRCVQQCLAQDGEPTVLIFDNHSNDGTKEYLNEQGILSNERVRYFFAKKNLGGAGGFSRGMQLAYEQGFDYIWMMDDDGYPVDTDCLRTSLDLSIEIGSDKAIINALVTAEDHETLSFSTGGFKTRGEMISVFGDKAMLDKISPFNGTLVSKEIISKIGFPRSDFFIKGDETEYTYRAKSKGIQLVTSIKSDFFHPLMSSQTVRLFCLTIRNVEESYWKEYYRARNYVYIYKTYFGRVTLLKHVIRCILKCFLYQSDKARKRKYTILGLKDGFKDKFENIEIKQ